MGKLEISAPKGTICDLYPNAPTARSLNNFDKDSAILPTEVTENDGVTFCYADLPSGLYHYVASFEGCYSVCQLLNHNENTKLTFTPEPLAGNGYEPDFVMHCTSEFEENAMPYPIGSEYEKLFSTPWFSKKRKSRHQQTTNEELQDFITNLENKYMHIFSLGKSPKYGYDIPLVLFTKENVCGMTIEQAAEVIRNNKKPTVQYCAQCHATEPASCEGALAMMVSLCGDYGKVLDSVDLYIIPRVNPDGAYEVTRHSPNTGEDMNRDYLYMHNQELRMVVSAYNLFRPEVSIDTHEKKHRGLSEADDIFTDVEIQTGAGALNHPDDMTKLVMKIAKNALENINSIGLRSNFYGKLASAAGGYAGSSYFGTRNSLSFLVETPGQTTVGGYHLERRVMSQYMSASSIINYVAEHTDEIIKTVHNSREYIKKSAPLYDENNLIVLDHGPSQTGVRTCTLLNATNGELINSDYKIPYNEHTEALATRPRATAFVIPTGLADEDEILRLAKNHALEHYLLPAGSTVQLRQYMKTDDKIELSKETYVFFEKGAHVFPNIVDSTILSVVMEPDFSPQNSDKKMTLFRMGIISADENGLLPLYRYCHNLKDGKI